MNIYFILLIVFLSLVYIGLFWGFFFINLSIKEALKGVGLMHLWFFVAFLIAGIITFLLFKSGII